MYKRIRRNQKKNIQDRDKVLTIIKNKELRALIFNFKQIIIPLRCLSMIKKLIQIMLEVY